jgi:GT2 family glycosyltransferase
MKSKIRTGFVFTNYNNTTVTYDALKSISLNRSFDGNPVIVVDNNSDETNRFLLRRIEPGFPNMEVIYNTENQGYFKGLNEGIVRMRKMHGDIDIIVAGNNDLIFPEDFLDRVAAVSELFGMYPVVSPDIVTLDGQHQNPHVIARIGKFREFVYDLYYSSYFMARLIGFASQVTRPVTGRKDEKHHATPGTIYQGYGACYLLTPVFFEHFNELWSPSFLMGEEFFLSRQLEQEGLRLWYEPSITVRHQWHAAMDSMPSRRKWEYLREAHAIYRKYVSVRS